MRDPTRRAQSRPRSSFIDFANTLSARAAAPDDVIPDADALLDWLREHGLISARGRATEAARLRRDPEEAAAPPRALPAPA